MSADRVRAQAHAQMERHIAYHEAGHSVVAILLGRDMRSVSLDDRATVLDSARLEGLLASGDKLSPEEDEYILQDIKMAMAGYVGEIVGLGRAHPASPTNDLKRANVVLKRLGPRKGSGFALQEEITELLTRHRDALKTIAQTLLLERKLTGDQVQKLMNADRE